jgi:hypothetical protein
MSHAIAIPNFSKDFIETINANSHSPISSAHPISKKFTSRLVDQEEHFGFSNDLYMNHEEIKIEEKSQETSRSNFRY